MNESRLKYQSETGIHAHAVIRKLECEDFFNDLLLENDLLNYIYWLEEQVNEMQVSKKQREKASKLGLSKN